MNELKETTDYSEKYICKIGSLFHDFFAGGGGGGGTNANITTTQTNPVVPDDMKALADSLNAIATGQLGAPVNFGPTGIDAPKGPPLVPQASMGQMFSQPAFQAGMQGMRQRPMQRPMAMRQPLQQQNRQPFTTNNNMGNVFARR